MTLLHSTAFGEVRRDGERLVFVYPGRLVTAGVLLVACVWGLGAVAMLFGGVVDREPGILAGGLVGLAATGAAASLARFRTRRMGRFTVDRERLVYEGDGAWPLGDVRFETAWDPFHRGFELHHWLVARVPDGRGLRLTKGTKEELAPLLATLREWGG